MQLEKENIVKTPFGGVGIIRTIKNIPWGFKYEVEILQSNSMYDAGSIEDFKEEQLEKIEI